MSKKITIDLKSLQYNYQVPQTIPQVVLDTLQEHLVLCLDGALKVPRSKPLKFDYYWVFCAKKVHDWLVFCKIKSVSKSINFKSKKRLKSSGLKVSLFFIFYKLEKQIYSKLKYF